MRAFVSGVASTALSAEEAKFFSSTQPWGAILFGRNVETPAQVRKLTSDIRFALGRDDAPILIDQEGGRVQRLHPPYWRNYPKAIELAEIFKASVADGIRAVALQSRLIADELCDLGITIDCLPVLDVATPETHDIIGNRTYGAAPETVAALGRAAAGGLLAGGCLPVIKHIPGHGRATTDSHLAMPKVTCARANLEARDFLPFRELANLPIAMTAHVLYTDIDAKWPATQSKRIIAEVIRGFIGFDGLLLSDDLGMEALSGGPGDRAGGALDAGCDIALHCNGEMAEMQAVAAVSPQLSGQSLMRAEAALDRLGAPEAFDAASAAAEFEALTGHKF